MDSDPNRLRESGFGTRALARAVDGAPAETRQLVTRRLIGYCACESVYECERAR